MIYNYNTNLNKINKKNIRNTNISKNETHNYLIKKVKQTKIASQNRKETTDINIRQKKRDENKHIIDISDFDNLNDSLKSSVSIKYMLERFDERERQKKEKIEKLKKLKEEEEKKYYTHIPKICKKTEELTKKIKDDFLTRQKIYNEKKNINEKKLKENILKNEQEKINKNNFILQKKIKENASVGDNINTSFISDISSCNRSMVEIEHSISKLFEWDNKRKEKIIKKQKDISFEIEKNKHIPDINKKSKSMVNKDKNRNKSESIFDRLSKEDDYIKAKKMILEELYMPTFKPNINLTFRNFVNDKNIIKRKYKRTSNNHSRRIKTNYSRSSVNLSKTNSSDSLEFCGKITVNRNLNIKPKISKNEKEIIEKGNKNMENEEIFDEFRKKIISNLNKK